MQKKLILVFVLLIGICLGAIARDAITGFTSESNVGQSFGVNPAASSSPVVTPEPDSTAETLKEQILQLQLQLDDAISEQTELAEENAQLEELLANNNEAAAGTSAAVREPSNARFNRRGAGALTIETLVEAGINERDATNMKSRLDELSMQRLYMRDQAMREGWIGKEQYRTEIRRINEAQNNLENEFGQKNYDRYLYAMGRPNRVTVQAVIENSPAYNASVQNGDQIISYGGERIYSASEIRRGTQSGTAGELVPIVVERNGQRVDLYVPRGPLGVQMNSESVRPVDEP